MADTLVVLVRGINVGRANRVAMAYLRDLVGALGYTNVRTLLNSGNVVLTAEDTTADEVVDRIEGALAAQLGVSARVTALTGAGLDAAVAENPLLEIADKPSRLMVAFLRDPADRAQLEPLLKEDWRPEALALGTRVAYLWCPDGVRASRLTRAVDRVLGDAMTTRNWATVNKLHALAAQAPS
jgi:uncharacterized protein (DUF1697 family)